MRMSYLCQVDGTGRTFAALVAPAVGSTVASRLDGFPERPTNCAGWAKSPRCSKIFSGDHRGAPSRVDARYEQRRGSFGWEKAGPQTLEGALLSRRNRLKLTTARLGVLRGCDLHAYVPILFSVDGPNRKLETDCDWGTRACQENMFVRMEADS